MQHAPSFTPVIAGGTSGLGEQAGPPAFGRYSGGVSDMSAATLSGTDVLGVQSAMGTTLGYSGPVSTLSEGGMPFENPLPVRMHVARACWTDTRAPAVCSGGIASCLKR